MRNYTFTMAMLIVVAIALTFPGYFSQWRGFELKRAIIPLLQVIMLGMGSTLSLRDFESVLRQPRSVIIGLACQFTIMPLLGCTLAHLFAFPSEVAAGVILVGCVPCGLASNVMSYIARANVPLSITIVALATLVAPLLTPLLMRILGSTYVQIDFWKMTRDMLEIVVLPIVFGLILNRLLRRHQEFLKAWMPRLSMTAILIIASIVTAAGQKQLLAVGWLLPVCVLLHNLLGYCLGYWSARALGMSPCDARTVAIEVGLQNTGLASGLAFGMGKVATVGLAPALFGPLMNVTGSLLAVHWGRNPPPSTSTSSNV